MFSSSIRYIHRAYDYDQAHKVFNSRGPVRSKKWKESERPLYKTYHHYRVERSSEDAEYYDVILYDTVMARHYKPVVIDGKTHQTRFYTSDNSPTSRDFMRCVLNVGMVNKYQAVDGREVMAPLYPKNYRTNIIQDKNMNFSAKLVFVDGLLDTAQSQHLPHFKRVSSKDEIDERKDVAKKLESYIMLAQMRIPEFEASVDLDYRLGRPFNGESFNSKMSLALKNMLMDRASPEDTDLFFDMVQGAFDTLASKRAYKQEGFMLARPWGSQPANLSDLSELKKPVTALDLRIAILSRVYRILGISTKSNLISLPQFVVENEYPRTSITW